MTRKEVLTFLNHQTNQNEVSLWLEQEKIPANGLRKVNLIKSENKLSYPIIRSLFLF